MTDNRSRRPDLPWRTVASRVAAKQMVLHVYKVGGFGILGALLFLPLIAASAFWGRVDKFVDTDPVFRRIAR